MSDQTSTALTIPERAAIALNSTKTEADLRALIELSADIEEVKDSAGRDQVHRLGMNLKNARIAVEKTGKAATEDAVAFHKGVVAEAKRLVEIITPEEKRVFALRDGYDAQVEAEKQAKIAAERQRMEHIEGMIQHLRDYPRLVTTWDSMTQSEACHRAIRQLEVLDPNDAIYEEFAPKAKAAIDESLATLHEMHARAVAKEEAARAEQAAREAEAQRMKEQRAEMARQKAELDRIAAEQKAQADALQRQREEQEKQAQVAAETKRQLEAQQAAIAAARRLEQDHTEALVMNQQVDEARYSLAWIEAHRMNAEFDILRLEQDHTDALALNAQFDADRLARDNEEALAVNEAFTSLRISDTAISALMDACNNIEPTDQEIIDAYVEAFGGTAEQAVARLIKFAQHQEATA